MKKTPSMSNPRDNFVSLITFLTIENNNLNIHGFASIKSICNSYDVKLHPSQSPNQVLPFGFI